MSNPRPLSDDWLSWNPETIHQYPASISAGNSTQLDMKSEPVVTTQQRRPTGRKIAGALLRDIAAGVVSGIVAAILLTLVIAFFPGTARATQAIFATANTELTRSAHRNHQSLGWNPIGIGTHERNLQLFRLQGTQGEVGDCLHLQSSPMGSQRSDSHRFARTTAS